MTERESGQKYIIIMYVRLARAFLLRISDSGAVGPGDYWASRIKFPVIFSPDASRSSSGIRVRFRLRTTYTSQWYHGENIIIIYDRIGYTLCRVGSWSIRRSNETRIINANSYYARYVCRGLREQHVTRPTIVVVYVVRVYRYQQSTRPR